MLHYVEPETAMNDGIPLIPIPEFPGEEGVAPERWQRYMRSVDSQGNALTKLDIVLRGLGGKHVRTVLAELGEET
jgi:hypothetical protein